MRPCLFLTALKSQLAYASAAEGRTWDLGETEFLTIPAPVSLPKSRPHHEICSCKHEDNAWRPEAWKEQRRENRNTHQGADDEEPPPTLLYHLSIAAFTFHAGDDSLLFGYQ